MKGGKGYKLLQWEKYNSNLKNSNNPMNLQLNTPAEKLWGPLRGSDLFRTEVAQLPRKCAAFLPDGNAYVL